MKDTRLSCSLAFKLSSLALATLAVMAQAPVCLAETGVATETTRQFNAAVLNSLPFSDRQDFADAARGLVAKGPDIVIHNPEGRIVWDMSQYQFLNGDAPLETVNPSLRRQAALNGMHGLFKVTGRVYQVRGYDLANMGIIVGDTGYLIDRPAHFRRYRTGSH